MSAPGQGELGRKCYHSIFVPVNDAPLVPAYNAFCCGQADPVSAGGSGAGGVGAVKAVKISGQLGGIQSGAGVRYRDLYVPSAP